MKTRTPFDLLLDQLSDLYSVESQLLDATPLLLGKINDERLKEIIASHLEETLMHAKTVATLLLNHDIKPGHDRCKAMEGLIKGGHAHINAVDQPATRDLMIIAHCLRIEHYEIAGYSIAMRLAASLKLSAIEGPLKSIITEEQKARDHLMNLEPSLFAIASSQTKQTSAMSSA